jgi:hypothetical protein
MACFENTVKRPYGYFVIDLNSNSPEHQRLNADIFAGSEREDMDQNGDKDVGAEIALHSDEGSNEKDSVYTTLMSTGKTF